MSHEEIWDDSALVESWDEAVAEYKRYHSIHARGEKIENVLKEYEQEANGQAPSANVANGEDEAVVEDGVIVDGQQDEGIANGTSKDEAAAEIEAGADETSNGKASTAAQGAPSLAPPLPPHLVGSVQDEGLKNLLMSWYYAGYYTGLYEGQKKGHHMPKATDTE